jgi:hypothetical protein
VREESTLFIGKLVYWFLGAPAAFLSVMYVGTLPLLLLGPTEERSSTINLVVAPYSAFLFVAALYLSWACWRAVRGDPPASAFRPFPWPVWVSAIALGLISGTVAFMRAP